MTLTVGQPEGGPWAIQVDGATVETIRSGYDTFEVLLQAETYAHGDATVLWRLTDDGGFEAVMTPSRED